jgi:Xaa-Pro dipeptidase
MFVDELQHAIARYAPARIYVSKGVNTDSGTTSMPAHFDGMEEYNIDESRLYADVVACRTIKNEEEIKLMKFVNAVSSEAHFRVMQQARPGMMEFQVRFYTPNVTYR